MDRQAFDELAAIMDRLAQGDEAAVVALYERFRGRIAGAVQQVAALRGTPLRPGDLEGVVVEVCFELARVASAWSPDGGALPWVWARHRVANVVDRELGQWTEPLDEQQLARVADAADSAPDTPSAPDRDTPMWPVLERIAADHHGARLLLDALERSGVSRRDRELWLEYVCEKAIGNPAPATTVGPVFEMREPTVRQAARRVRTRVRCLATTDDRYAPLAGLPALA